MRKKEIPILRLLNRLAKHIGQRRKINLHQPEDSEFCLLWRESGRREQVKSFNSYETSGRAVEEECAAFRSVYENSDWFGDEKNRRRRDFVRLKELLRRL